MRTYEKRFCFTLFSVFAFLCFLAGCSEIGERTEQEDLINTGEAITFKEGIQGEVKKSDGESDLYLGKIEPVLKQEIKQKDKLNIIVYVMGPVNDDSIKVKSRYKSEIEVLSRKIEEIRRHYGINRSSDPGNEGYINTGQEGKITGKDKARLEALNDELDAKLHEMRRAVSKEKTKIIKSNLDTVSNFIIANKGTVTARIITISAIGATIPGTFLRELAEHDLVSAVAKDRPRQYESE